jgi:hypothetical protein
MKTIKNTLAFLFSFIFTFGLSALVLYLLLSSCSSCTFVKFDNVNEYKGSIILKIEQDSIGTINTYRFYIKDTLGNYDDIIIDPNFAQFFLEDDTIK